MKTFIGVYTEQIVQIFFHFFADFKANYFLEEKKTQLGDEKILNSI